jgi:hypothetical protein
MVGAGGLGGLVGGYLFDADRISAREAVANIKVSAAEAVSFRFPNQWHDGEAESDNDTATVADTQPVESAPTARYAVASAGSVPVSLAPKPLLNPKPLAAAVVAKATDEVPETQLPPWAMAAPVPLPTPRPKMALASATMPEKQAAVAPKPKSNAVLNSTQIASIKRRLNLTPDQERYWPAVEAQLRKMEYKKGPKGDTRTASIDMSKMDVQGLRTAGFPLVMSFNDEQKRELKSLAHLLGLENAMSGF